MSILETPEASRRQQLTAAANAASYAYGKALSDLATFDFRAVVRARDVPVMTRKQALLGGFGPG